MQFDIIALYIDRTIPHVVVMNVAGCANLAIDKIRCIRCSLQIDGIVIAITDAGDLTIHENSISTAIGRNIISLVAAHDRTGIHGISAAA